MRRRKQAALLRSPLHRRLPRQAADLRDPSGGLRVGRERPAGSRESASRKPIVLVLPVPPRPPAESMFVSARAAAMTSAPDGSGPGPAHPHGPGPGRNAPPPCALQPRRRVPLSASSGDPPGSRRSAASPRLTASRFDRDHVRSPRPDVPRTAARAPGPPNRAARGPRLRAVRPARRPERAPRTASRKTASRAELSRTAGVLSRTSEEYLGPLAASSGRRRAARSRGPPVPPFRTVAGREGWPFKNAPSPGTPNNPS